MTPSRALAAILVCFSGLCYVLNDSVTKLLIDRYDVSCIILIRSLVALPVLYLLHARIAGRQGIGSRNLPLHAIRGAIGLTAAYLYIASLEQLTVAEATVILFLSPVLITAISSMVLKEPVSLTSWLSVSLCFLGVVIAINPGGATFKLSALLVVVSSLMYALNAINARWIPPNDNLWTIAFFGALFSALFITPTALRHWSGIHLSDLLLFGGAATFSSLGIGMAAIAYRMAPAAFLAAFGYSGLVWSLSVTWILWGVIPSLPSLLGATIILCSVALNFRRHTRPGTASGTKTQIACRERNRPN